MTTSMHYYLHTKQKFWAESLLLVEGSVVAGLVGGEHSEHEQMNP